MCRWPSRRLELKHRRLFRSYASLRSWREKMLSAKRRRALVRRSDLLPRLWVRLTRNEWRHRPSFSRRLESSPNKWLESSSSSARAAASVWSWWWVGSTRVSSFSNCEAAPRLLSGHLGVFLTFYASVCCPLFGAKSSYSTKPTACSTWDS